MEKQVVSNLTLTRARCSILKFLYNHKLDITQNKEIDIDLSTK